MPDALRRAGPPECPHEGAHIPAFATVMASDSGSGAVTKHGRTVGFYIPVRRRPQAEDLVAYQEASEALQSWVRERGLSEDALVEDFNRLRKAKRRRG